MCDSVRGVHVRGICLEIGVAILENRRCVCVCGGGISDQILTHKLNKQMSVCMCGEEGEGE